MTKNNVTNEVNQLDKELPKNKMIITMIQFPMMRRVKYIIFLNHTEKVLLHFLLTQVCLIMDFLMEVDFF